ncbi:MAG: hypothetical protein Q4C01_07165 [Clostridia bacterium]|nr:hypothetical protein [Clostridia bacterium]
MPIGVKIVLCIGVLVLGGIAAAFVSPLPYQISSLAYPIMVGVIFGTAAIMGIPPKKTVWDKLKKPLLASNSADNVKKYRTELRNWLETLRPMTFGRYISEIMSKKRRRRLIASEKEAYAVLMDIRKEEPERYKTARLLWAMRTILLLLGAAAITVGVWLILTRSFH